MDPSLALVMLLDAVERRDVEAYWLALEDMEAGSAQTGKLPEVPHNLPTTTLMLRARSLLDKIHTWDGEDENERVAVVAAIDAFHEQQAAPA